MSETKVQMLAYGITIWYEWGFPASKEMCDEEIKALTGFCGYGDDGKLRTYFFWTQQAQRAAARYIREHWEACIEECVVFREPDLFTIV